jgi:hypothetical protein
MLPLVGALMPVRISIKDVFPIPLGPISPILLFLGTVTVIPWKISTSPKDKLRLCVVRRDMVIHSLVGLFEGLQVGLHAAWIPFVANQRPASAGADLSVGSSLSLH